jgi:diguanylate cyclase (GGDEF)-like protein
MGIALEVESCARMGHDWRGVRIFSSGGRHAQSVSQGELDHRCLDSCLSILFTNIWLSHQIERDAIGINLAGRQRMLSQQMSKTVLLMNRWPADAAERSALQQELSASYHLFDDTLTAFQQGGRVLDTQGKTLWIAPIKSAHSDRTLSDALTIWAVWRPLFQQVSASSSSLAQEHVAALERFAQNDNRQILVLMNALTTHLESEAHQNAEHIRLFQMIAMLLALLNFIVILVQFFRQLEQGRRNQDFLNRIINKIDSSVLVHRQSGEIVSCNKPAGTMFGMLPEQLLRRKMDELLQPREAELAGVRPDGSEFFAEIHSVTLETDGGIQITTVHDVSAQRAIRNSLHEIAYHDALTHLPNRLLIFDRLKQEISRARRYDESFAVCFIDLDGFKRVNDQHGHAVGDKLLQRVTDCLKQCTRESDTLGRLGGDEFVMILPNIRRANSACDLAREVIDMIGAIRMIDEASIQVGASIGIALYPDHGTTLEELLKQSDQAMYEAKRAGKNSLRLADLPDQVIEVTQFR